MLGIAVIALLGLFLYHYRPRNFETKFKQSLRWSEFAKGCFVCHPIFWLTLQCGYIIFMFLSGKLDIVFNMSIQRNVLLYPFDVLDPSALVTNFFMYVFPVFSAWLMHKEIIEPLRKDEIPRQSVFHLIGLVAITSFLAFYSIIISSYFAVGMPYLLPYEIMLQRLIETLIHMLPIFSILLIGIGAVEISRHKAIQFNEIAIRV